MIPESYDRYILIPWPDVQGLMDEEGFDLNASLATDEWSINQYGSQAYFVNEKWLESLNK